MNGSGEAEQAEWFSQMFLGDVLIVNNNYQHYAGEIQIVRIPFKNDGQRNYLGHLAEGEELMLDLLKNFDEVTFLKAK